MSHDNITRQNSLEKWSAILFLIAGGLMIVFAANTYLRTFGGTSYPVVQTFVGPVGFILGLVGLLGLYPALADRSQTLARVAAVVAAVSAAVWSYLLAGAIIVTTGIATLGAQPAFLNIVLVGSMILGFALFGLTSLRAGVYSRVVGLLLLAESAMWVSIVSGVGPPFAIETVNVLAFLGVGISLRATGVPTGRADLEADLEADATARP